MVGDGDACQLCGDITNGVGEVGLSACDMWLGSPKVPGQIFGGIHRFI